MSVGQGRIFLKDWDNIGGIERKACGRKDDS